MFDNNILDHIMPRCAPNTWKVVCATIRKTIGWQKETDQLSLAQYQSLTGIAGRQTLLTAVQDALACGYIVRTASGKSFKYRLNRDFELDDDPKQAVYRYGNRAIIGTEIGHTKERKKASSSRVRDDRIDHPACKIYKDFARLYVPHAWREEVVALEDLYLWATIVKEWIGLGWNPTNVKGMIEAYRAGGIQPRKNGKVSNFEKNVLANQQLQESMNE